MKRTRARSAGVARRARAVPVQETAGAGTAELAALRARLAREKCAREEAELRFVELADHLREVHYVLDARGMATYLSPEHERLWGGAVSRGEALAGWPPSVYEGDLAEVTTAFEKVRRGESAEVEYRIVDGEGAQRWVHDRAYPIRDGHGAMTHVVGLARDITAERDVQLELRAIQKKLGVGGLTRGIAHDFSNVLQVVVGCAMLAARPETPPDRARAMMLRAKEVALRGGELVRRLSGFAGRDDEKRQPVVVDDVVRTAASMLAPVLGEHIRLDLRLAAPGATVRGTEVQIEQLLVNVAGNARDAMPAGGTLVFATNLTDHDRVELVVADTGVGMDAWTRARAFEPLFTTKPGHPGLGLATVLSVAQQLGGGVELTSELGRGTTVRMTLPARAAASPTVAPRARGALSGTALLLEDEAVAREAIRRALEESGLEVWEALDDGDALALAEAHPPDLLVSDVLMPRTFGPDVARRLRARHPGMSVLFIAGDPDGVAEVPHEHATGVLPKPFAEDELLERVRELLAAARPANETESTERTSGVVCGAPPATVLVVEDEETARTLLRKVLADAGYHALAAGTAADARSVAERENIDVLLTDLRLPDGHGDSLASELTRRHDGLAVLYVSGDRARPTTTPGTFLEKPVDLDELLDVLGGLARARRQAGGVR